MNNSKTVAIILSAGKGKRMGTSVSKQYLEIKGKPILFYTLKAFEESNIDEIIIVTGKGDEESVKRDIVDKYRITKVTNIVCGGAERYDSVMNGLNSVERECSDTENLYVLIHDGARPLIKSEDINKMMSEVLNKKACIAGVPVKDTIKIVDEGKNVVDTPARKYLWQIQTPQAFRFDIVFEAYKKMYENKDTNITDDSMVVEKYGASNVSIVEIGYHNIKITTKEDLDIMAKFLEKRQ